MAKQSGEMYRTTHSMTRFAGMSQAHDQTKLPAAVNREDQNSRLRSPGLWTPRPGMARTAFSDDATYSPATYGVFRAGETFTNPDGSEDILLFAEGTGSTTGKILLSRNVQNDVAAGFDAADPNTGPGTRPPPFFVAVPAATEIQVVWLPSGSPSAETTIFVRGAAGETVATVTVPDSDAAAAIAVPNGTYYIWIKAGRAPEVPWPPAVVVDGVTTTVVPARPLLLLTHPSAGQSALFGTADGVNWTLLQGEILLGFATGIAVPAAEILNANGVIVLPRTGNNRVKYSTDFGRTIQNGAHIGGWDSYLDTSWVDSCLTTTGAICYARVGADTPATISTYFRSLDGGKTAAYMGTQAAMSGKNLSAGLSGSIWHSGHVSANGGASWTDKFAAQQTTVIVSGSVMYAQTNVGAWLVNSTKSKSTDGGTTWNLIGPTQTMVRRLDWASGQILVGRTTAAIVRCATDAAAMTSVLTGVFYPVVSDGTNLWALRQYDLALFHSSDSGATWTPKGTAPTWGALCLT